MSPFVRRILTTGFACAAVAACDESTGTGGSTPIAFESLLAGDVHACGLTADGLAYCWGNNGFGQLGSGDAVDHFDPTPVAGELRFERIDASWWHTCGLTAEGVAYCWGWNNGGQLGDGTFDNNSVPVPVTGDLTFASISAGSGHTCALTAAGVAYCWGSDSDGQLGDGTAGGSRGEPLPVLSDSAFTFIRAGEEHTCALTADGTAYCWGSDQHGQLGRGAAGGFPVPTPDVAAPGLKFTDISTSRHDYTCGVAVDGTAYCWGHNDFAQLGRDTVSTNLVEVGPISSPLTFQAVVTSIFHSCGLATDGSAHCWGGGRTGELGNGSTVTKQETPVAVLGGLTFRSLTLGNGSSCGLTTDGVPYCWGLDAWGQFGNGETSDVPATEPVPAAGHG